ncbi:MAG: Holliday junction branch migration protein RuvA [Gammaproteobacteria bacterium]
MIGFLRGRLAAKKPPQLIIDVNGVGYEVDAPMSTFYQLPAVGDEVNLYTHLVVRDDAHTLFGFASEDERRLFRELLKISGVGARMALTILSGINVEGFLRCVEQEDTDSLVRLPGVGKKTAARLVVEMRDRLFESAPEGGSPSFPGDAGSDPRSEAYSALVALGYRGAQVNRMLKTVEGDLSTEELIRQALQNVARQVS